MNISEKSIFNNLNNFKDVSTLAIIFIVLSALVIIGRLLEINVFGVLSAIGKKAMRLVGKFINKKEKNYHRDIEIGKINEKRAKIKRYRFLNDLIIDLGIKQKGATPYEFLVIVILGSGAISFIVGQLIFGKVLMGILLFPIMFAGIMCGLYTKANISHDARIEAIIESENIISNNIKDGVVVTIRNNIDLLPARVRGEFQDFLNNMSQNYHIKTALMELNNNLGSTADDFIKKCILFEMEEEHGIVGMFKDKVEINNIKTELRIEMKRKFEVITSNFVTGLLLIFTFLGGVIALFDVVANFYFKTMVGQLIIAIDGLIIIGQFVFITYLRAKDL